MQIWLLCRNDVVIMKLGYFWLVFWHHFVWSANYLKFFLYCVKLFDVDCFPSPETDLQLSIQPVFLYNKFCYMLPHWLAIVHKETSYEYKNSLKSFLCLGWLLAWTMCGNINMVIFKKFWSTFLLNFLEKQGKLWCKNCFFRKKIRRMATICHKKKTSRFQQIIHYGNDIPVLLWILFVE